MVPSLEAGPLNAGRLETRSQDDLRSEAVGQGGQAVTDVAYIGGAGRSGSTILALALGQLPGFVAAGGVRNLSERGLQGNYLCGCGAHFPECTFWDQVGREAFGG